jgi:phosphatidylglycerol:prolipoprotein diacylglycerol transferase
MFVLPFPNIDPVLIEFGPLALRWYGLAYLAGLLIGWWYVARLVSTPRLWGAAGPPVTSTQVNDLLLWVALGVILGGRFGYILFYKPGYYLANPIEVLEVWHGGMSFHGGMLGVVLAVVVFCWKNRLPLVSVGDSVAAAVPIGLFFGRLANFINGELYGRVTDVPWAMIFPHDPEQLPRHPSQLYEAFVEGIVLFVLLRILTHRTGALRHPGVSTGALLAGYGTARFGIEFFREPDAHLGFLAGGWLTMGMMLSIPMVLVGLGLIAFALRTKTRTA